MEIRTPYLLFLGDAPDALAAKTAVGVFEWRPDACIAQLRLPGCVPRLDLAEMDVPAAARAGARTLLIGVANRGGIIPASWVGTLVAAIENGLDLASGLHTRLSSIEPLREAASRCGRDLHDVRHPRAELSVADGRPRSGHRLLTVGSDCSVGKMYTALALEREMSQRGLAADFRATGQTGILIDGAGISVDAVVADFISGAVEALCPAAERDHWDVIEGQGSLHHPSFAGVSLGLLHGAQPDCLVLCHEPTRTHMRGLPDRPLPSLRACIETNLAAAEVVSKAVRFVGISANTRGLDPDAAEAYLSETESDLGLPCVDPLRTGVGRIVDELT